MLLIARGRGRGEGGWCFTGRSWRRRPRALGDRLQRVGVQARLDALERGLRGAVGGGLEGELADLLVEDPVAVAVGAVGPLLERGAAAARQPRHDDEEHPAATTQLRSLIFIGQVLRRRRRVPADQQRGVHLEDRVHPRRRAGDRERARGVGPLPPGDRQLRFEE